MIKNYFKTAWRSLWKNKITAGINIAGLSVGMTAAILILLWVQNEISFDSYHPEADKIYRLTTSIKANGWIWETTPLLMADAAKKNIPEIERMATLNVNNMPVFNINGTLVYEKNCAYVDDEWFNMFHYKFIEGNPNTFSSNPYSIILTASEAKRYFGNRTAVGADIRIDSLNYRVKAIVEDAPANSSFQYNAFIPLSVLLLDKERRENDQNWGNFNYITFVKLKPGTGKAVTEKKLTDILPDNNDKSTTISLIALKDIHFETGVSSSFIHGSKSSVYIFTALAFLLLLIASINYVNLTTAKAGIRAKEISVRKIIGAHRMHLFFQFVAESLLISFIALVTTIILIHICISYFNIITNKNFLLPLNSISMWKVIGCTLFVAFLLNSIYPALLLSSFRPLDVFRGLTVLKVKDGYLRKGLVVLQFSISVMLIAGSIVIYKQMQFIQKSDPGYNRSQILSFPIPPAVGFGEKKNSLMQTIKQELLSQSGITNVALTNQEIVYIGSISTGNADWDGHDTTFNPKIRQLAADADFQKTMQLQLQEGRWFQQDDEADKNNVVLNETALRELNIHRPVIGQRFTFKGRKGQVIGVMKDFKYQSMHDKTGPLVAFNDPNWFRFFMVRITPGNPSHVLQHIQNLWKKFLPESPLEYHFLDDSFNDLYKADQQASLLIFIFALIAVLVSALGLFGLASFTAEHRTKEIGIRKVLGASATGIMQLLSKDFVKPVIAAILIASPVAWLAMNKWLQNFAYRINISWWMLVMAGLLAVIIALATVSFQAFKAAIANPVKSLRTE